MISFAASRARCAAGCFCFFLCGSVQVVGRCNRVAPRIPQRWDGGVAARGGVLPRWLAGRVALLPCCGLDWVGLGWVARSCGAVVAAMITVMLRARVQCTWVSYMMGHENSNMLQV